jgi:hypothetical protein
MLARRRSRCAHLTSKPVVQRESYGDPSDELTVELGREERRTHPVRREVHSDQISRDVAEPVGPNHLGFVSEEKGEVVGRERVVGGQSRLFVYWPKLTK